MGCKENIALLFAGSPLLPPAGLFACIINCSVGLPSSGSCHALHSIPVRPLSIPVLAGGDRSSLGATRDAQGRMLAAAWHQVTQAMGSISPGKTRVSPHPSSYLCLLPSNVQAPRGWGRWERTNQPQVLGAHSRPPLGRSLGVREGYGWAWELVNAAGDSVLCF